MQYQNFSGVMSQISTVWKLYGYILYTYIHIPNYTVGDERLRFPAKHFQNFGSLGNPSFVKEKKKKKIQQRPILSCSPIFHLFSYSTGLPCYRSLLLAQFALIYRVMQFLFTLQFSTLSEIRRSGLNSNSHNVA